MYVEETPITIPWGLPEPSRQLPQNPSLHSTFQDIGGHRSTHTESLDTAEILIKSCNQSIPLASELSINLLDRTRHEYCRAYQQTSKGIPYTDERAALQKKLLNSQFQIRKPYPLKNGASEY
ncbi:MAG: hypothetical protein OXE92_10635 [Bacteroidetes bacterium]|nr:hypothetical protein [Bacteroidota bacterium]